MIPQNYRKSDVLMIVLGTIFTYCGPFVDTISKYLSAHSIMIKGTPFESLPHQLI